MSKFFVSADAVDPGDNKIMITGEDVKHIKNVLRSVPGDTLKISDGNRTDYDVVIKSIDKESIVTEITGTRQNKSEPPVYITLLQGIPKADKMEYIIQKCVELGVSRIVPVMSARTVVKIDGSRDAALKAVRWRRIALEAAKQCDRGIIPLVEEPVRMDEALKLAEDCSLKLLPYEEESEGSLRQCLEGQKKKLLQGKIEDKTDSRERVAVFIGPEGGFEDSEVEKAVGCGFKSVTLGPRILRTETAGPAVAAVIMYELGDMGKGTAV